jgi:hypothetical protein
MMHRLWRVYVRAGALKERTLRAVMPSRMRFVHYSWPLRSVCPCDVHFCDYLVERDVRAKSIFHFGTGGHHIVGRRNLEGGLRNDILGLTLSPREHAKYVTRVVRDPELSRHYKVLFADVYSLSAACLPLFDIVTLFHLCEFAQTSSAARRMDDAQVVRLFCSKLPRGGLLLLYTGSYGYGQAAQLVSQAVAAGWLSFDERYKSLAVFRAENIPDAAGVAPLR